MLLHFISSSSLQLGSLCSIHQVMGTVSLFILHNLSWQSVLLSCCWCRAGQETKVVKYSIPASRHFRAVPGLGLCINKLGHFKASQTHIVLRFKLLWGWVKGTMEMTRYRIILHQPDLFFLVWNNTVTKEHRSLFAHAPYIHISFSRLQCCSVKKPVIDQSQSHYAVLHVLWCWNVKDTWSEPNETTAGCSLQMSWVASLWEPRKKRRRLFGNFISVAVSLNANPICLTWTKHEKASNM